MTREQGSLLPQVPQPPQAPSAPAPVIYEIPEGGGDPSAVYEAFRHQRGELREQLDRLESQRDEIARQLQRPDTEGASKAGLEQRIAAIDARIADVEKAIAASDASVARAAAVPGAVVEHRPPPESGPPEEFWVIAGLILVPSAFILTIAYARRLWRRGAAAISTLPQDIYDRFTRVEQGIDAVAVEVERIGEGQRYLTRMYTERGLGAGPAQPIEQKAREAERQR